MINEEQEIQEVVEELISDCNAYSENQNRLNEEGAQQLNEDLWEKIKYGLSKLGRYKAGGKIRGKRKIDKAQADLIKGIIEKKGNEVIQALDAKLKETNPKFPNNEKQEQFLNTVLEISAVYDSIVAATKLKSNDKGFLPIDVANGIIEDLATYVKKYLDVDLAAVYSTMDEAVIYADSPKGAAPTTPAPAGGGKKPDAAAAVRTQLQNKTGADATTRDSQRMQTLKSNKLPLVLAGVGTALGALGWLAQTDWMANLLQNIFGGNTPGVDAITQTIDGGAADPNGMVHWMSEINSAQGGAPIQTGADIQEFINTHGIDNVQQMFQGNGGGTVGEQGQLLQQLIGGDGAGKSVGELFRADTFGDMKMGRNLFGISKAARFVSTVVVKQAVKAGVGAGVGVAASVAGVGAVLVPIGIGLIATGALVKLMRMKGQKQSRAKTLNDLFQSIQQVKGTPENPPVVDLGPPDDEKPADFGVDKLLIIIKRLLIFINGFNTTTDTEVNPTTDTEVNPTPDNSGDWNQNWTGNDVKQKDPYFDNATNSSGFNYDYKPNVQEGEELEEGRYIKNPDTLNQLNKLIGNQDTVKKFEGFLVKLVVTRNAIKKMPSKATGDINLDNKIEKLKANPIMKTNFMSLVNIDPADPNSIKELKNFIVEVVKIVESGKLKHANILSKLNERSEMYPQTAPKRKVAGMTREEFKKTLLPFIGEIVTLYRLIGRYKKMGEQQPLKEDVQRLTGLNEQVEKMKHLIRF